MYMLQFLSVGAAILFIWWMDKSNSSAISFRIIPSSFDSLLNCLLALHVIELMYLFHVVSFLKELAFSCLDKIINVEKIEKSLCEIKKILSIIDWKYFQESHSLFEILYQKVKNGDKGKI